MEVVGTTLMGPDVIRTACAAGLHAETWYNLESRLPLCAAPPVVQRGSRGAAAASLFVIGTTAPVSCVGRELKAMVAICSTAMSICGNCSAMWRVDLWFGEMRSRASIKYSPSTVRLINSTTTLPLVVTHLIQLPAGVAFDARVCWFCLCALPVAFDSAVKLGRLFEISFRGSCAWRKVRRVWPSLGSSVTKLK